MALVDSEKPETPAWWLVRLVTRLIVEQRPRIDMLDKLYRGEHPLPVLPDDEELKDQFRDYLKHANANYLALVVEAPTERMKVAGFRTGSDDEEGDKLLQDIWRRARLDADQTVVYRTTAALSLCYVMVGDHPRRPDEARISIEDPRNVITESWPDDRREQRVALKLHANAFGVPRATLIFDRDVYTYEAPPPGSLQRSALYTKPELERWSLIDRQVNTLGEVCVVPFMNRATVDGKALCEFEEAIPSQMRLNATLLHRMVAEKFGAFRQIALLNAAFDDDENGDPITPDMPASPAAVWTLEGQDLAIWQSQQTSTSDIRLAASDDVRDIAALTRTPPHYLLNNAGGAVSGDALKVAETGLVSKVRERMAQAAESWEQVLRLVLLVLGEIDRADASSPIEILWQNPESRSDAETADAVVKRQAAGVPWRARMEFLGYTPTEIDRMESERTQDALLLGLSQPPAPAQLGAVPATSVQPQPGDQQAELIE